MGLDKILSQFKVIAHRLQQTKQKKTQEMLFKRASEIVRRNNMTLSRIMETPLVARWSEQLEKTSKTFGTHCSAFCAQRIRRTTQILSFYRELYGDSFLFKVIGRMRGPFQRFGTKSTFFYPRGYLFAAAAFCWKDQRISEEQIQNCISDMKRIETDPSEGGEYMKSWECIVDREDYKLWRKTLEGTNLYQYKMYGTYKDVCPRAMFQVQKDLEYRKTWDSNVIDLSVVDTDSETGSEVVRWVTYYPYPLHSREYVYVRNCKVDTERNLMVVIGGAVEHPNVPQKDCYVRVTAYQAEMVIKPHTTFDQNGLDYVLTYYDDPQATIPSPVYHWVATRGETFDLAVLNQDNFSSCLVHSFFTYREFMEMHLRVFLGMWTRLEQQRKGFKKTTLIY